MKLLPVPPKMHTHTGVCSLYLANNQRLECRSIKVPSPGPHTYPNVVPVPNMPRTTLFFDHTPSNIKRTNHIRNNIRLSSKHLGLVREYNLAIIESKPIVPLPRVTDIVA